MLFMGLMRLLADEMSAVASGGGWIVCCGGVVDVQGRGSLGVVGFGFLSCWRSRCCRCCLCCYVVLQKRHFGGVCLSAVGGCGGCGWSWLLLY